MRPNLQIPSYCHHKPKNLAYVRLNGDFIYLGEFGSAESHSKYERLIAEWLSRGRTPPAKDAATRTGPGVNALLVAYLKFVLTYYVTPDGQPSVEQQKIGVSLKPVRELYGETPAEEFGPVALKAVRQTMIQAGLCRNTINQRIG